MILALLLVLAQAPDADLPLLSPKDDLQVTGTAPRSPVDREGPRQAALADALRKMVEAAGGKVSENVPSGTATHWRGRFSDGVSVVADLIKQEGQVVEDATKVEVSLAGGGTAALEVRKEHTDRPLDPKVLEATFGADSTTAFRIVREYEAAGDIVVELAYVFPEASGDVLPFTPGRRWTWAYVQRWPVDASRKVEEEVSAAVEKVEDGVAHLRVNHLGTFGSRSDEVEVEVGKDGPRVKDVIDTNGSRVAQIAATNPTETGLRWMTERMQRVTLPGLFASLVGHVPLSGGATWRHEWRGETSEGQVEYEEEAKVVGAGTVRTPAGIRAALRVQRDSKERIRIDLGEQGVRRLVRTRAWTAVYADGVGCARQAETEQESTTTTSPDGQMTDPVVTESVTTWELTACTGAR